MTGLGQKRVPESAMYCLWATVEVSFYIEKKNNLILAC
jgi:hypothetical protein